jgi:hypothetical protein
VNSLNCPNLRLFYFEKYELKKLQWRTLNGAKAWWPALIKICCCKKKQLHYFALMEPGWPAVREKMASSKIGTNLNKACHRVDKAAGNALSGRSCDRVQVPHLDSWYILSIELSFSLCLHLGLAFCLPGLCRSMAPGPSLLFIWKVGSCDITWYIPCW